MNERLKDYLSKRGAKPLETKVIKSYAKTMREKTVPLILEDIKQREQLAAESRYIPSRTKRRKKKSD